MPPPLPPGYAEVVRAHHRKTTGYLLATQPGCRAIRTEEVRRVRRRLLSIETGELTGLAPTGSWLLAVLLCPGDDTRDVARWARRPPPPDRERIRFYYHPRVDLQRALGAWVEAGLGSPLAAEVRDFASSHKAFGKHLNDRVWLDYR